MAAAAGRAYRRGMKTALITGASRGLGLVLSRALAERHWRLVIDARGAEALEAARLELAGLTDVAALAGDVADDAHRRALVAAANGRLDLLVDNASVLGPSPQPHLARYPLDELERVYRTNAVAPLALVQLALPLLPAGGCIVNVSSDAAVEGYEGWGGYGSSKAALERHERARRRAPRAACVSRRPRRHEHEAAAGCLPRRGRLRPTAAGGERPRPPGADRGRAAERPLRRARAAGVA